MQQIKVTPWCTACKGINIDLTKIARADSQILWEGYAPPTKERQAELEREHQANMANFYR